MKDLLIAACFCACIGIGPGVAHADTSSLRYQQVYSTTVQFGRRIDIPYILDSYDVDGDGADDFAMGAKYHPGNASQFLGEEKIHSFFVANSPTDHRFQQYDLGPDSATHRTWSGQFFPSGSPGSAMLAVTGNGEIGMPGENAGEPTVLYRIGRVSGGIGIQTVFVERTRGTSGNVAVCDIDRNGSAELVVNNVSASFEGGRPDIVSRVFSFRSGGTSEASFQHFFGSLYVGYGGENVIALQDVNGDGRCDALVAFETYKRAPLDPVPTESAFRTRSYVMLNTGRGFSGGRIDLPNPPFGGNNSAHAIATTMVNGEPIVALASSNFPSHEAGFNGFALQLFALRQGQFVEVTDQMLVGRVTNTESNQSYIRFADIDGDGDQDMYLTRYDRSAGIYVYLQDGGRFIGQRLSASGPSGQRAVAFLHAPGKACMDMAVLDERAKLFRFDCQ